MAEQTSEKRKTYESRIPEDVREHAHAAREEMRKSFEAMMPPGYREHRRKARKEMLLAWRGLLDHAIQRIDDREKKDSKS